MTQTREVILNALSKWVRQRSGIEYRNYASDWRDTEGRKAFFAERRAITKDLSDFHQLMRGIAWRSSIDGEALKAAFSAFSGRLEWNGVELSYTTGQYFPTEYRKAACAVLARALWVYSRESFRDGGEMRKAFRKEFGRGIQSRWFN